MEGGTGEVGDEKGRRWVSIRVGFDLRLTLSTLFSSIGRHLPCRRKRDEDEEAGVKKKRLGPTHGSRGGGGLRFSVSYRDPKTGA